MDDPRFVLVARGWPPTAPRSHSHKSIEIPTGQIMDPSTKSLSTLRSRPSEPKTYPIKSIGELIGRIVEPSTNHKSALGQDP